MAAARVDWKRRRVEGDQGGDVVVAASVDDDGSSDHDPNDDRPRHMLDSFDLSLRSEELTLEKRLWSHEAMEIALSIRRGVVRDIVWWYPKIDSPSYALANCRLQLPYGVHPFCVDPLCCQDLLDVLQDPSRWREGFFSMGGTTWPGYGTYPYVHARFHISALQEKKTIRVQGYANVCVLLQTEPTLRRLVEEVRCVLGLPGDPGSAADERPRSSRVQPRGKSIRALHFIRQDETQQASFTWHSDAEDIKEMSKRAKDIQAPQDIGVHIAMGLVRPATELHPTSTAEGDAIK